MTMSSGNSLEQFKNLVGIRFQLYNSLFTSLPFHRIEKTGVLLSLFLIHCEEAYKNNESPNELIENFFKQYTSVSDEKEKLDLLFRFVQYTERQVVLFDALEDAAFSEVNDMNGPGTVKQLFSQIEQSNKEAELEKKLKDFSVRIVLTAHPTQFYPGEVLGIIHDLSKALSEENTILINQYLQQLGRTPFLKKEKPTPLDEATSLIWYLENVFYEASGKILSVLKNKSFGNTFNPVIRMGFWPGGDRDGNPFVTSKITLQVARALHKSILKCYHHDVRKLKRRLTFKGIENKIAAFERRIYNALFNDDYTNFNKEFILNELMHLREALHQHHNNLFINLVEDLINKVNVFGLFFATLDVRQESSIHTNFLNEISEISSALPKNYNQFDELKKIKAIEEINEIIDISIIKNDLFKDACEVVKVITEIQQRGGEEACNRYIMSHCTSALNVLEVYAIFILNGWKKEELSVDIVPLFETIEDLQNAATIMPLLYSNKIYKQHLELRNNTQTVMLGFSDGTKDGGYLMANWSIYRAKEELTKISADNGIDIIFFDGRGGPPARGGGKTHKFFASLGKNISSKEIQLTVQGQTVSSNFGTIDTAQFNIEQLINAGISSQIFFTEKTSLQQDEKDLLNELATESFQAYSLLKNHPKFLNYLSEASPLKFYAETNIGSRPSKRKGGKLDLNDLRAIPFVGAWSQMKQNVPGYFGVGTALKKLEEKGKWENLEHLYHHSLFFKTLIDNCEMAMKKSFFPLTSFLAKHVEFGEIWKIIYEEYQLTIKKIFQLSNHTELMQDYPVEKLSIEMRERIVLPLSTIQQYCITKLRETKLHNLNSGETLETLIIRCSFGIINAGRNSA